METTTFEMGHKFDMLDLFTITPKEVGQLFARELVSANCDMENLQVFLDSGLVDVNKKYSIYGERWSSEDYPLYLSRNNSAVTIFLLQNGANARNLIKSFSETDSVDVECPNCGCDSWNWDDCEDDGDSMTEYVSCDECECDFYITYNVYKYASSVEIR